MQCEKKGIIKIIVKNPINITRRNETIELTKSEIKKIAPELSFDSLQVLNSAGEITANQKIDRDDDAQNDIIIFQTDMKAGETKSFEHKSEESREFPTKTYARFVPERKNDFAWEK